MLKAQPGQFDALHLLGVLRAQQGEPEEAVTLIARALERKPHSAEAHSNLGNALQAQGRHVEAVASFERALALKPGFPDALNNRGAALVALGRHEEAIASYERALALRPRYAEALCGRGNALNALGRHPEAVADYEATLSIQPDYKYAHGLAAFCKARLCDWEGRSGADQRLVGAARAGKPVSLPVPMLAVSGDPADQLACARAYARDRYPAIPPPLWTGEQYRHERIRVAYLSADFREHVTAYLAAGLFEQHDRARFETLGISFGPDDRSGMRTRIENGFERFIDVRAASDADVAKLLRDAEVDIAVDLMGFTKECRPGILARRPAPVQVSYLGYPATMGAGYIDYILADEFVIPTAQRAHYAEKVVTLPGCFQVNDSKRAIAERTPTRAEAGLPAHGFVFCCFNNSYKLTPAVFDVWMRLLQKVEHSVLWLVEGGASTGTNLHREAAGRGVDPGRLVFAPRVGLEDYLARYRLADLFLDTLPFNAGATASDALWAGLPLVTCAGDAMAARMAGSLLHAVGLPELVTDSLDQYEAVALTLATQPGRLQEIKERLARGRTSARLFDTSRFRRNIEAAYLTMWEIAQRGEKPRAFAVGGEPAP